MALFGFKKKVLDPAESGAVEKGKRTIKRSPTVVMGVKLLVLEGLEAGDSPGRSGPPYRPRHDPVPRNAVVAGRPGGGAVRVRAA